MKKYIYIGNHVYLNAAKIVDYFMGDPDFDVLYIVTSNNYTWTVSDQVLIDDIRDELQKFVERT